MSSFRMVTDGMTQVVLLVDTVWNSYVGNQQFIYKGVLHNYNRKTHKMGPGESCYFHPKHPHSELPRSWKKILETTPSRYIN